MEVEMLFSTYTHSLVMNGKKPVCSSVNGWTKKNLSYTCLTLTRKSKSQTRVWEVVGPTIHRRAKLRSTHPPTQIFKFLYTGLAGRFGHLAKKAHLWAKKMAKSKRHRAQSRHSPHKLVTFVVSRYSISRHIRLVRVFVSIFLARLRLANKTSPPSHDVENGGF